jgi:hypothetical protein
MIVKENQGAAASIRTAIGDQGGISSRRGIRKRNNAGTVKLVRKLVLSAVRSDRGTARGRIVVKLSDAGSCAKIPP